MQVRVQSMSEAEAASDQSAAAPAPAEGLSSAALGTRSQPKIAQPDEQTNAILLVAFNFQGSQSHRMAARAQHPVNSMGLVVTIALHLLVAAALLFQWQSSEPLPAEPMIFVQLTEEKAEKPVPTAPAPKIEQPKIDMPRMVLPNIIQQPNTITPPPIKAAPPPAAPDAKVVENYASKMMRHLNRYKRYPAASRQRREEGIAQLSFTIDHQGNVLSSRIVKSSGHQQLDEETLAMVRRASPIPVPPQDLWKDPMELVVPVDFSLVR